MIETWGPTVKTMDPGLVKWKRQRKTGSYRKYMPSKCAWSHDGSSELQHSGAASHTLRGSRPLNVLWSHFSALSSSTQRASAAACYLQCSGLSSHSPLCLKLSSLPSPLENGSSSFTAPPLSLPYCLHPNFPKL